MSNISWIVKNIKTDELLESFPDRESAEAYAYDNDHLPVVVEEVNMDE